MFLFVSAFVITRGHLAAAVLAAGALFLFLCHMTTMTYVGRSDATSLCLLVVCGALAHRLLVSRHHNWSDRRHIATQVGLGAASAALFLTSWRYIVPIAALQVVVVSSQIADDRVHSLPNRSLRRLWAWLRAAPRNVSISTALYLAGFALVWVPVFLQQLHGDFRSYYRHFFGFFSAQSGWGTYAGSRFRMLPDEVVKNRLGSLLFLLALMLWGLYRLRKQTAELIAWSLMLSATWLAVSYGYYKNQGGGGQHYYVEFFGFAWIFVLHAFSRGHRWSPLTQLVLVCAVVLTLPVGDLLTQQDMLADARAKGRTFRAEVARLTQGQPVFSEELHLFRLEYRGELVDTGDADAVIARTGYFGEALTRTYDKHIQNMLANPPKFVLAAMFGDNPRIVSPPLHDLLQRRYARRVTAPGSAFAIGGGQALFERKD